MGAFGLVFAAAHLTGVAQKTGRGECRSDGPQYLCKDLCCFRTPCPAELL